MDVDSGIKPNPDDLSQYKLDDYDDDAKESGQIIARHVNWRPN